MTGLPDVEPGTAVRIVEITGGDSVRRRLFSLGLHLGDRIVVAGRGILRGPLLVRHEGSGVTIAIGRSVAQKIIVEP